jgi:hypothetical protein
MLGFSDEEVDLLPSARICRKSVRARAGPGRAWVTVVALAAPAVSHWHWHSGSDAGSRRRRSVTTAGPPLTVPGHRDWH